MKLKSILLTAVATLGLTASTVAQVPNYVPTNGLVGWWPFNGNTNDESGNGNNGTNNGATLTTDRNGNSNKAFSFDGIDDFIEILHHPSLNLQNGSINLWFKTNSNNRMTILNKSNYINAANENYVIFIGYLFSSKGPKGIAYFSKYNSNCNNSQGWEGPTNSLNFSDGSYHMLTCITSSSEIKIYVDAVQQATIQAPSANADTCSGSNLRFGKNWAGDMCPYLGDLDDIGIWKRVLTQQEITNLYNGVICNNNTTISPQTNSLKIGSTATFNASTSDPNPSYVWQSDFGQGFQTLNNFGNYSGKNTKVLSIANVQLSEHKQPIRVISTSGKCIDTSNVAVINIMDTCITNVTVYDTLLSTVTDTLVINTKITGINPPNNLNTLKVFPNPSSTHITIDYGNFNAMSGYTLKIINTSGQTVYTTSINQQTSYIDLSTWSGNGIYYLQLIDPQNNTIENRKIVLN
jgi:hypothetical protein